MKNKPKRPDDRLWHRCQLRCPVCEWVREGRPEERHEAVTPPVKAVHPRWPTPLRGTTALSLLGARVVRYE